MYKSMHKIRTMYSLTITPARYKRDKPALLHQFIVGLFSKGCELRQADQAFTSVSRKSCVKSSLNDESIFC